MAKPITVGIIGVGLEPRRAKVSHLPTDRALAGVALARGRGVRARDSAVPRGTLTALEQWLVCCPPRSQPRNGGL